jgi:acetyltransferase-like isoleucine patch superfamily enzyme
MAIVRYGTAKTMLARLLVHAAGALVGDPLPHAERVVSQGGFSALARLVSACEGEAAAWLLRRYGARVGARPMIHAGLVLVNADVDFANIRIGDGCHVGNGVLLDVADAIDLGDRVTIAMRSMLLTHSNAGESRAPHALRVAGAARIRIEDDAYLGAGTIVLPGVTIGAGAVVGAGAIVTRDVAPGAVVAGNPARAIAG